MLAKGEDASPYLPDDATALFADHTSFSMANIEKAILASLCLKTPSELQQIADVSEGLEYALLKGAYSAQSLSELIATVKSKRYPYSRIRRMALNAYLGITKADAEILPRYIRILDFNETGRQVLNHAKSTATLPLAKNGAQIKDNPDALALWQRELMLDRVYQLFL